MERQFKRRTSGLYLDQEVVDGVDRLRAKDHPVPTFNQKLVQLIKMALARCFKWLKR